MQFYLLLALSGVISGGAVLAQKVTGYAAPECSGPTTFTYVPITKPGCVDVTNQDTMSVNLSENVQCVLYPYPGCTEGEPVLINNPGCTATQPVGSYACVLVSGN